MVPKTTSQYIVESITPYAAPISEETSNARRASPRPLILTPSLIEQQWLNVEQHLLGSERLVLKRLVGEEDELITDLNGYTQHSQLTLTKICPFPNDDTAAMISLNWNRRTFTGLGSTEL